MKKRMICLFLTIMMTTTGCGKSSEILLTYSGNNSMSSSNLGAYDKTNRAKLFADDLVVIPSGKESKKDGNLTASSAMIVNDSKDSMLYADNVYERLYPASITKIVTALIALKYADLTETVTVSYNAANIKEVGAKKCGIQEGDQIVLEDLLWAFLVYSGNDAGIAIAEHISGTEEAFVELMNEEVKKLGAAGTNFTNSHGLHNENHYTTAYDLYLIFHELLNYDKFLEIIKCPEYVMAYKSANGAEGQKTYKTTNRFLTDEATAPEGITVIGGKTGTTMKAGSCLILYSQDKKAQDYISIVLGAQTADGLFSQMTYLLQMINNQ